MPDERLQFRVLFRSFLFRMVDIDVLSAGGDAGKLASQGAALLSAFGFAFLAVTVPKYATGNLPPKFLPVALRADAEFLCSTTMAIAGLLAVLAWNTVLPDRRDCAVLCTLPVRSRTIFLGKLAAIASLLGAGILAFNLLPGLCVPLLLLPPGAGLGAGVRSLAAYWITMGAIGVFVCCGLLALQGLFALALKHRHFLRVSGWVQLAAFFMIPTTYFLRPPLPADLDHGSPGMLPWFPSFWFFALISQEKEWHLRR
jgi:hypothetical protein